MDANLAGNVSVLTHYSMKILSGPLFGVDLSFPSVASVSVNFISQDQLATEAKSDKQSLLDGLNSLVVPAPAHLSTSFILSLDPSGGEGAKLCYQLVADAETAFEDILPLSPITLNKPITIGLVTLAIKHNGSDWSRDVLLFNHQPSLPPAQEEQELPVAPAPARKKITRFPLYCALALIVIAGVIAGYLSPTNDRQSLAMLLAPINPDIIRLKNGETYVITSTEANVQWIWQAITKNHLDTEGIEVVAKETTLTRLEAEFHEMKTPFHRLELSNERDLELFFSQERCRTADCDKKSQSFVRQHFPWINQVNIHWISDKEIVTQVNRKLSALGLQYDSEISPSHARFMLHGVLEGEQYSTLEKTISALRQQYGVEYAQFIFGLEESRLRPLTFRSGDDSYAIISDYHWLYPY